MAEIAATKEKRGGVKVRSGAVVQKSNDGAMVIKSGRRRGGTGGRRNDQVLEAAFSGGASVLCRKGEVEAKNAEE